MTLAIFRKISIRYRNIQLIGGCSHFWHLQQSNQSNQWSSAPASHSAVEVHLVRDIWPSQQITCASAEKILNHSSVAALVSRYSPGCTRRPLQDEQAHHQGWCSRQRSLACAGPRCVCAVARGASSKQELSLLTTYIIHSNRQSISAVSSIQAYSHLGLLLREHIHTHTYPPKQQSAI